MRRSDGVLRVWPESRPRALASVLCWLALVAVYYASLLGWGAAGEGASAASGAAGFSGAALMLLPLAIVPYVWGQLRVVVGGGGLVLDRPGGCCTLDGKPFARICDIVRLHVDAANGTCEEATLSAVLRDGRRVELLTTGRVAHAHGLALCIAGFLDLEDGPAGGGSPRRT